MVRPQRRSVVAAGIAFCAVVLAFAAAPPARAERYSDVPSSHWARTSIESVTQRGPAEHKLLDDYGDVFKPETAITRAQLARSLVIAGGHYGEKVTAVAVNDVPRTHRYFSVIQVALHYGYMRVDKAGDFRPSEPVPAWTAEVSIVRWLKERYASSDWGLLTSLAPSRWEPNPAWTTGAPSYLPWVVASRQLLLRFNHSEAGDSHEVVPRDPIDRAEVAYMFWRGFKLQSEYGLWGLANFKDITFPALSERQKEIASFALRYVGYPYVWAGEFPTRNSPYGYQKAGGFDCSGFVFYVMKLHFGYPITVDERGASDMAARAKPRRTRSQLKAGDLIFFGPSGPESKVESIYHAGLYLGRGWFIHSTGSSDGVTLASLNNSSYWKSAFAWGRRLLAPDELVVTPAGE